MSATDLTFGARGGASDDPIVNAALAFKQQTIDFLATLARASGLDQRFDFTGTTLAEVPALVDELVGELDTEIAQPTMESTRGHYGLFTPRMT